jgi:aromatase
MAGHTDNSVLVAAPLDLVWEQTNDIAAWPELFSEYSAAEVIERRGDTVRFRLTTRPDEHGTTWSWVSERTLDTAAATTRSHRVETGIFKYMSIFWEYTPTPEGVRMRWVQDFEMRPTAPLDDAAMTRRINHNSALQMARIKRRVEELAASDAAVADA